MRRLQTDYIELLYRHRVDPEVPMEHVEGAPRRLRLLTGKVRYFGLSEAGDDATSAAPTRSHPVAALQREYSLPERNSGGGRMSPLLRELGMGLDAVRPARARLPEGRT